jgi:hypothetical protein
MKHGIVGDCWGLLGIVGDCGGIVGYCWGLLGNCLGKSHEAHGFDLIGFDCQLQ